MSSSQVVEHGVGFGHAPLGLCDGQSLRAALLATTAWFAQHVDDINALNVFPVPDGDTGTNMYLTLQAACQGAGDPEEPSAARIAHALAQGALMGARGNSGVILSQILRGLALSLEGKDRFDARALAEALHEGALRSYAAVADPVEGTILTVMRECARAAVVAAARRNHFRWLLAEAARAAQASVAMTPSLLPVLREAGVVDAGGQGLYVILEGMLRFARGSLPLAAPAPPTAHSGLAQGPTADGQYGYEVVFLLRGVDLSPQSIRREVSTFGDSVVVVGDSNLVKVHVHAARPEAVLDYAGGLGSLQQVGIEDLQEQTNRYLAGQSSPRSPEAMISTIAVAAGEGLAEIFRSIGASAVVPGGQSMNPSVAELLQAVDGVPGHDVIVLPNNKNIILTAGHAREITRKRVVVIPTENIPQGISALVAFRAQAGLETNVQAMTRASDTVQAAEVTRAVRDAQIGELSLRNGEWLGLIDGMAVAAHADLVQLVAALLARMRVEDRELVTVYYGASVSDVDLAWLENLMRERYPTVQLEVVNGGQPHYTLVISAE